MNAPLGIQPTSALTPAAVAALVFTCLFSVIANVAVALRFWSRRVTGVLLGWNDWWILVALVGSPSCSWLWGESMREIG